MTTLSVSNSEKIWLIRSSARILGPFSLDELTAMLLSKQISIIDEFRQPEGRWNYFRESQYFMDIVKSIRDQQDNTSEKTVTFSVAQATFTHSEITEKTGDEPNSSAEIPRDNLQPELKNITLAKEKLLNNKSITEGLGKKAYGLNSDQRLRKVISRQVSYLRWVLVLIGVAAILFFAANIKLKKYKEEQILEASLAKALRYKSIGLYEQSLNVYKTALQKKEPAFDIQAQMATLLISEDKQSVQGRKVLEKSLNKEGLNRQFVNEANLGIAISYSLERDFKSAENTLQKVLARDPANSFAQLNFAILKLKLGDTSKAMHEFDKIYQRDRTLVLALLGYALSAIESNTSSSDHSALKALIPELKSKINETGYMRQQLSLLLALIQNHIGDVDGANMAVVRFLGSEIGESKKYSHSLLVDWRVGSWEYLEKYCYELYEKSNQTAELKALRAICLMEVHQDSEGEKLLGEALAEGPKDPYILAVKASSLLNSGQYTEAKAILKMPSLSSLRIKDHILAEICRKENNIACVEEISSLLYKKDRYDVVAIYGLAWVNFKKKNQTAAYEFIRTGLDAEPNYLPLIELQEQMESQK